VADGGKDDVGGIALAALEMAAAEVTVGFHVSDHGLDSAAASQFALHEAEHAALLARDEDAAWIGRAVTTISLVDIGTQAGSGGTTKKAGGRIPACYISGLPRAGCTEEKKDVNTLKNIANKKKSTQTLALDRLTHD
jgi:hypothetical protein